MPTETEAAPATQTANEMPSPMQETPSSTVENLPQGGEDFATWLSDRLDNFQRGQETPPWEQKEEEPKKEEQEEVKSSEETSASEEDEDKSSEETNKAEEADDAEETKNMSTAAGAKFKELKSELKTYKAKVAEMEEALKTAQSTPQNQQELEDLRARLAEYEQEIAVTRVEATPEYKRAVLEPTQAILDSASLLADRYKVDARKLVNALREESVTEGSDALTDMAADFSERDRVRLYRMADDLADVSRRRDYLRENASKAYSEMEEKRKMQEAEEDKRYKAEATRAAKVAWEAAFEKSEKMAPVLKSLDEKVVAEIRSAGEGADLLGSDFEDRAYAVYAGVALPHLVEKFQATQAKVAELEQALSKYKKATPKVSGNTDTTPTIVDDGGFLDAIEKRFTNG